MSEEFKVTLPKLGESILSATVVQWFKKVGDAVRVDEPLLEVSTDKVNSEIPSPVAGVIRQILVEPEKEIAVGAPLVIIDTSSKAEALPKVEAPTLSQETFAEKRDYFSPALLRLAQEKGVTLDILGKIPGTGEGGRVTRKDLEGYLERSTQPKPEPSGCFSIKKTSSSEDVERLKMTGMRKAIADNMVRSFYEAPHATLIHEVDVTGILKRIHKEKEAFFAKHQTKLTITSFIARAIVKALQEYPLINSSLEQDTIVVKHFVNLGIAVSIEQGIMVPVIKHCQRLSLPEIAQTVQDLAMRARAGKLDPSEVAEGTITMTNFGISGVEIGIPIIRYPEVAIVGIGAAHKKVVVLEDDVLAIRSMMHISLTFDHRVLDGMYGCGFLAALKKHLEQEIQL